MRKKAVAIVQARMGATRLPGKVMMDLAGEPMLVRVVNRVRGACRLDDVVVATTTNRDDDPIVDLCRVRGWPVFRGSAEDVLDRYYQSAVAHDAGAVVRLSSDCPLIDPKVIDAVVGEFQSHYPDVDYVSNNIQRTFPLGLDVEAISFDALERAWKEDKNPSWREHVTPYIYRHPERFRIRNVANDVDYSHMRWTVDTAEDLAFVRRIYDHFGRDDFGWRQVIDLLEAHPEWLEINLEVQQKLVP